MEELFLKEAMVRLKKHGRFFAALFGVSFFLILLYVVTLPFNRRLSEVYRTLQSVSFTDRNGVSLYIEANARGNYTRMPTQAPKRFKELLLKKEDRFFYYHRGVNPASLARGAYYYFTRGGVKGSSTITQQLVKILLANESERTIINKLIELWYAVSLEFHTSKDEILAMYTNAVYFGNQAQGLGEASWYYFNKPPESLNDWEIAQLLATVSNPSYRFPGTDANRQAAQGLVELFGLADSPTLYFPGQASGQYKGRKASSFFELDGFGTSCNKVILSASEESYKGLCVFTIDSGLTEKIREIVRYHVSTPAFASAKNAAVVVLKLGGRGGENPELLALVGSPFPYSRVQSYQINMALQPRPIGSTVKPFIYGEAFKGGARPFTLVDDREYKYPIGSGFSLYPKNYDGRYRGLVTLHEAFSNSLNVPSVKVLEFVGLENFYRLLEEGLQFKPVQPMVNYQLGIALGALEMDLLTLSSYFTIFPQHGVFKPIRALLALTKGEIVWVNGFLDVPMMTEDTQERRIFDESGVQLINKILSDRQTGVEQFGIKSELNLSADNYALKTGTSRDFNDSWTVGYTPDFLVGVWVGNGDNTPMDRISGQAGAGKIWHDAMELLLNSSYNQRTPFVFNRIYPFKDGGSVEYGLKGDDYQKARMILLGENKALLLYPHNGDTFLFEEGMAIPLVARVSSDWFIDEHYIGSGNSLSWRPARQGSYTVKAKSGDNYGAVDIRILYE